MTTITAPTPELQKLRPTSTTTNYMIAPDQFEAVIAKLPLDQQDIIRWWYFLGKDRGWSLGTLAKACGSSTTTLSRVFRGDYGAELTSLCATLSRARESFHESIDNPEYIQTSLGNQIFRICDHARSHRTVAILWGAMGIGKTTVLENYKFQNNHGRTIYYRCEPGMTLVQFITSIGHACGVGYKNNQTQLRIREKIYSLLAAGQRLVIIDELHQLFLRREGGDITPVLQCEFLRAVFDKANCGMVLTGTQALQRYMVDHKDALAQLLDRGTMSVQLPAKPTAADANAFVQHYGLPPLSARDPEAAAIVSDILRSAGLRKFTLHLRHGASHAAKLGEAYTWSHFATAFEDLQSLSKHRN